MLLEGKLGLVQNLLQHFAEVRIGDIHQPDLGLTKRRGRVAPLVPVFTVERSHQEHRRQIVHGPQRAHNTRSTRSEHAGWQPDVFVRTLREIREAGFARREDHQPRVAQVHTFNEVRECQEVFRRQPQSSTLTEHAGFVHEPPNQARLK